MPKDYAGAWERSLQQKPNPTQVTAIGVSPTDDNSAHEHPETLPLWLVLPMPIATNNKFGSLTDWDDDDEDEYDRR